MVESNEEISECMRKILDNPYDLEPKDAEGVIELADVYMSEGRVYEAIDQLKYLEELIMDGDLEFSKKENDEFSDMEIYQDNPQIQSLLRDEKLIFKCTDTYKSINKRDPDRSSEGIDTWFKYEDNINAVTICGRVTLKVSIFHIIAMFREVDLLEKSVSQFEFLTTLSQISFSKWICQVGIKMPLTFSNRDTVLLGLGLFDKKEKMFIIAFKSTNKDEFDDIPDVDKNHCRIDMNYGFYIAKYLDDETCELFTCFNVDPKVDVPWFMINAFTKDFGYYMMNDFRKMVSVDNFSETYSERIKKNQKDYDIIKRNLNV
jgi:hypothetical protein